MKIDKSQFVDTIDEHQGIIHNICRIYFHTPEEREDLFQEIVLQLWKSFASFRNESKISTWIYRVALNTAILHVKRKKRNPKSDHVIVEDIEMTNDDFSASDLQERSKLLYKAIEKLSDFDKAIILLYLDEKSYDEISEITGLTKTNVGVKINRIKKKLEKLIKFYE